MEKFQLNNNKPEQILNSLIDDQKILPEDKAKWWLNYLHTHKAHYLELFSIIKGTPKNYRILEIGSIPGHFTILMKKLGFQIEGVDLDPKRTERLWSKYQITIHKVNVETELLPFESNSFDLVIFSEIIEHLRINPIKPLFEIQRVLKPKGRIILSTPNITPIMKIDFLLNNKSFQGNPIVEFTKLDKIGHMGHIRLYTLHEITSMLEYVNLIINSIKYGGERSNPNLKYKSLLTLLRLIGFNNTKEKFYSKVYIIAEKK